MRARLITDATYRSQKVRSVEPKAWRAEYTWLLAIAEDNGVFEFDPTAIWAEAYATARPDWTVELVTRLLNELVRVGLVQKWEQSGKTYGSFAKAALPPPSKRFSKLPNPPLTESYRDGTAEVPVAYRKATPDYGLGCGDVGESESDLELGTAAQPVNSRPLSRSVTSDKTEDPKPKAQDTHFKDGTPFPPNWDTVPSESKRALLAAHRQPKAQAAIVAAPPQDDAQLPSWLTAELEDEQ
jgi:hypothetical protein